MGTPLDPSQLKRDFPILNQPVPAGQQPLVFLDSAASSQKPQAVIDALVAYYSGMNANIHRGVYDLAEATTTAYEATREHVRRFINARRRREIIFTRGTTEAINLVARSWGSSNLQQGDLVVVSELEHHANLLPWQVITQETGARLGVIRMTPDGQLDMETFAALMAQEPKLLAITHISNALGTILPIRQLIDAAHAAGARVLLDAAQSAPHLPLDVQALDCDFLAFSGHKLLAPTGTGVLYGKAELLEAMPPYQTGGSMIRKVTLERTTWADLPAKFEAGTPAIGEVVALSTALSYLDTVGLDAIHAHEQALITEAMARLAEIPRLTIHGPGPEIERAGVISFSLEGIHPHDVAAVLNEHQVAVRAGHHCCQPVMQALGLTATTRASFYLYNTRDDIDRLIEAILAAQRLFA